MKGPEKLDPFRIDLEQTTLIEASAGTGKTYTITTLFARLVAMGYPVESILVVTFTEAAAAELKLRIRARLAACLKEMEAPETQDDLALFFNGREDCGLIPKRLRLALTCFDQAAVMTIHSFCYAALRENAFETGGDFDIQLVTDSQTFVSQTVMDFFLSRVNDLDPLFLNFLYQSGVTPENIQNRFRQVVSRPGIRTVPEKAVFSEDWTPYREAAARAGDILAAQREAVQDLIQSHKGVDKRSYSKKNLPNWLDLCLNDLSAWNTNEVFVMAEKGHPLYKFTSTRIEAKTKSGQAPPAHPFFDACEDLLRLYNEMVESMFALQLAFLEYFFTTLEEMKRTRSTCFFDDLINDLDRALTGARADGVKKAILDRYRACLIDEFQDTDPAQYRIFSTLFSTPAEPAMPFFMIGDPKQAIYAFRGGDIFAYLAASTAAAQSFTLATNYRSAPLLVEGVNQIFTLVPDPFGFKDIPFTRVGTPDGAQDRLVREGKPLPPLSFSFLNRENFPLDRKKCIKKGAALASIPHILARDILSLLTREASGLMETGGQAPMGPGDMAVLVRTNAQAEAVHQALSQLNIPSFLSKTGSVFDSDQARELFDILCAVDRPDHRGFLKAALASSVYGFTGPMLEELDRDDNLMVLWQDRFRSYGRTWETRGFVSMIALVFHDETVDPVPCAGLTERALTNFYHLVELVSQAALRQGARGPSRSFLLKWMRNQLFKETREETADELRLESDARAVAIVTIHKSKGLEYPIVFLPYLWEGKRALKAGPALFHDPDEDFGLCLDLGSEDIDRARDLMDQELAGEDMRLLYVALTRASAMCRIYWGGFAGADTSPLGRLLHPLGCGDDAAMGQDLAGLAAKAPESIQVISFDPDDEPLPYLPGQTGNADLAPRTLSRQVNRLWQISSYSALVSAGAARGGQPHGIPVLDGQPPRDPILLESFPKGAGAGDFFHAVFEDIDFPDTATIEPVVSRHLDRYGFSGSGLTGMAGRAVSQIISVPLETDRGRSFCLRDIPQENRLTELEFSFDLNRLDLPGLAALFGTGPDEYGSRLSQMGIPSFSGFIKGFIDLVVRHENQWYILDYKSNYLGPSYADYGKESLDLAMASHDYILQYHIYLAALDRYLRLRLENYEYDRHFGGIFYLFLRGMGPDRDTGVFFDRPPARFMEDFQALMA